MFLRNGFLQRTFRWSWTKIRNLRSAARLQKLLQLIYNGSILFRLRSNTVKRILRILNISLSSAPYLSGDTFKLICAEIISESGNNPSANAIVFLQPEWLVHEFPKLVAIGKPFVLVTHHSDVTIDHSFLYYANHHLLIHWYAQNCILKHTRLTAIPIGLEDRRFHCHGRMAEMNKMRQLSQLNKTKRKNRIIYSFNIQTNKPERQTAYNNLQQSSVADEYERNPVRYKKDLINYKFVASPPGNGLDCHRTWEALYFEVIPIVIQSDLYDVMPGFPGLIISDWGEVVTMSESYLNNQYQEKLLQLRAFRLQWASYWKSKIAQSVNNR